MFHSIFSGEQKSVVDTNFGDCYMRGIMSCSATIKVKQTTFLLQGVDENHILYKQTQRIGIDNKSLKLKNIDVNNVCTKFHSDSDAWYLKTSMQTYAAITLRLLLLVVVVVVFS